MQSQMTKLNICRVLGLIRNIISSFVYQHLLLETLLKASNTLLSCRCMLRWLMSNIWVIEIIQNVAAVLVKLA